MSAGEQTKKNLPSCLHSYPLPLAFPGILRQLCSCYPEQVCWLPLTTLCPDQISISSNYYSVTASKRLQTSNAKTETSLLPTCFRLVSFSPMGLISPPHDLLRHSSNTFKQKFESSTPEGDERNNEWKKTVLLLQDVRQM
ncbi:hypothetical protein KIN20_024894 [Parelaphostrongylus tenuis]|uniref:Uncharacterized protein n=1 Tax=Parelaphostrongylus tenuis TaxID=148309 RepID=A0AAD5MU92_PARTN|nr:hypothetical protein KIN20_024894 [Parelaphostrongylus tenuis]